MLMVPGQPSEHVGFHIPLLNTPDSLTILGPGEAGEQWSPAQSLESVLLSIQSLMSDNPYVNEPGFETDHDEDEATSYCAKIAHETLRISVLRRLEYYFGIVIKQGRAEECLSRSFLPLSSVKVNDGEDTWEPFMSLIKTRFLWYYAAYKNIIEVAHQTHGNLVAEGKPYVHTRASSVSC
jgi:ubiquitin-conjugating enzyme E2 Z